MSDPSAFPFVTAEYGRVAKWVVRQTGEVARDVLDSVDAGTYGADAYAKAMGRMFTIGLLGSIGMVDATLTAAAVVEGKGPRPQRLVTERLSVAPVDQERPIAVAAPFTRGTPNEAFAPALISFDPPILPPNQGEFVIRVNATDLPSGLYVGSVRVGSSTTNVVIDVEIEL